MQLQLTLDGSNTNKTDYEQELIAIWRKHVETDSSGVYVCWIQTEVKVPRIYRKKKERKEAQYQ